MLRILNSVKSLLVSDVKICSQQAGALFHTTSSLDAAWNKRSAGPKRFVLHNKTIFDPQLPEEKPRPAVSTT